MTIPQRVPTTYLALTAEELALASMPADEQIARAKARQAFNRPIVLPFKRPMPMVQALPAPKPLTPKRAKLIEKFRIPNMRSIIGECPQSIKCPPIQNLPPLHFDIVPCVSDALRRHGVTLQDISSLTRKYAVSYARREVFYLLHTEMGMSYSQIGRTLKKDHTTVWHSVKEFAAQLDAKRLTEFDDVKGGAQ